MVISWESIKRLNIRIELVATDGSTPKRIAWFNRKPTGFYSGIFISGKNVYSSYHKDGNRWVKVDGERKVLGKGQHLDRFKGIERLHISAFNKEEFENLPSKTFRMNKIDGVVYLDIRTFPQHDINVVVELLEPNHLELIKRGASSDIHIFTSMNPWLVISIIKEDLPIKTASNGFVVSGDANIRGKEYEYVLIG